MQETFLKLARSADSIHGNVAAWLHACARTTALDCRRRQCVRVVREREAQAERITVDDHPGTRHELEEQRQVLDRCLDELPSRDRDVVIRYYFVGQTQQQIANELGVSHVAVLKRLKGALAILRRRCLRRGIAVAGLMALLSAQASAAEVPGILAKRLASLKPAPGGAGVGPFSSGVVIGIITTAATAVGCGLAWLALSFSPSPTIPSAGASQSSTVGSALSAVAESLPTAAVAPAPTAPTPAKVAAVQSPTLDLSSWTFSVLDAKAEMVDLAGEQVPALRLISKPATFGLATTVVDLPREGYTVELDYRALRVDCPFTSVSVEPAFNGVDSRRTPLVDVAHADGKRSPLNRWRHYRADFHPIADGRLQAWIWIDGNPFRMYIVMQPGAAEDRLHLRVIGGELQVARLRVSPLAQVAPDFTPLSGSGARPRTR